MSLASLPQLLLWPLALIGVVALALGFMLAAPLTQPPRLASIHAGALAIGEEGKPDLSRFQARDGTWLAYRLYPAGEGQTRPARDPRARLLRLVGRNARDRAKRSPRAASRRSPSTRAATAPRGRAATSPISASSTTISPISSRICA